MSVNTVVSVVIPAYNAGEFIEDAVKSCFSQTYRPIEVIVVNDGSTDATVKVVHTLLDQALSNKTQIKVIDIGQNTGAANALRVGFSNAKGDYVCWLSADDMFIDKRKLEKQFACMTRMRALWSYYKDVYRGISLSAARFQRMGYLPHLSFLDSLFTRDPDLRLMLLLFRNPINGSSTMIRRDCFETFGQFDPITRNVDPDGDLWMRYSFLKLKVAAVRGAPVFYREHSKQTSKKKQLMLRGCELTRMRMLLTLEKKGVLPRLIRKFAPFFPIVLGTGQHLTRPFVSEFLFEYISRRESQFSEILVKCARRSLVVIRKHPNYFALDKCDFTKALGLFMESQEYKRFEEIILDN